MISWNPDTGKMNWYFQYTPGDHVGLRRGRHPHPRSTAQVGGQPRKLITHSARNGFLYTMERNNGQTVLVKPYLDNINWTKGIDQKTGKPLDYDPSKDIQIYAGVATPMPDSADQEDVPVAVRRQQFLARDLQPEDQADLHPDADALRRSHAATAISATRRGDWKGGAYKQTERCETNLTVADPLTGEIKNNVHIPYPNYSGVRCRPPAASFSRASPTARSPPTTTPRWSSCGRSMSAPASTRRR